MLDYQKEQIAKMLKEGIAIELIRKFYPEDVIETVQKFLLTKS